jgi:hypothetical protein
MKKIVTLSVLFLPYFAAKPNCKSVPVSIGKAAPEFM